MILGFVSGVLFASFVSTNPLLSLFVILVGSGVLVVEKLHKVEVVREVLLLSILIISFGAGMLRYEIKDFHIDSIPELAGIVVSEPAERENTTRFVLLSDNGQKVLVSADLYSPVQYGDRIKLEGKLSKPGVIDDGESRPFDYGKYLSKDDIYHTLSFASVEIVSHGHGNPVKHALFSIKRSLVSKMKEIFAEPESSLLAGLMVAGKGVMPRDILDEFRRAGVIHIVVLSGYNITIIAEFMRKMFENIFIWARLGTYAPRLGSGPMLSAGASIIGIALFVLMTGAEATVVRAALMVLVVIVAKMFGRTYSAPRALAGAAFLMILHNPKILVFDASFQLSFLATCGLIYVSPIVENSLSKVTSVWGVRTMLATTIATQITVLPYLIYSMGDVSLVSLPANILVLLFIPLTMLSGFVATLLAYISPILAWPLTYLAHIFLAWILGVSSVLGNLSFASINVPLFPFWVVIVLYLLLTWLVTRVSKVPHISHV